MGNEDATNEKIDVRRGRVGSVDLYEVKENELDILESGSPASIYLNFAIFLLSSSITCIASLCFTAYVNNIIQITFICFSIIGVLGGILLLILWWNSKESIKQTIKVIRNRLPHLKGDAMSTQICAVDINIQDSPEKMNLLPR